MSLAICLLYTLVAFIETFGVICIFMVTISFLALPANADRITAPSLTDTRIYLSRIRVCIVRSSRGCHSCRDVLWFCSMSFFFTSGIPIDQIAGRSPFRVCITRYARAAPYPIHIRKMPRLSLTCFSDSHPQQGKPWPIKRLSHKNAYKRMSPPSTYHIT
jgi:hypothetical protein